MDAHRERLMLSLREAHKQFKLTEGLPTQDDLEACKRLRESITRFARSNPTLRPKSENQDVGTPPDFLYAVRNTFGKWCFDLAGSEANHTHPKYYTREDDSLSAETRWPRYPEKWNGHLFQSWTWLNPEYKDIGPWVERCVEEKDQGRSILVLVPASVNTRWWADYVQDHAYMVWTTSRMTFVGANASYPRDLALLLYSNVWSPAKAFDKIDGSKFGLDAKIGRKKGLTLGTWDWKRVAADYKEESPF